MNRHSLKATLVLGFFSLTACGGDDNTIANSGSGGTSSSGSGGGSSGTSSSSSSSGGSSGSSVSSGSSGSAGSSGAGGTGEADSGGQSEAGLGGSSGSDASNNADRAPGDAMADGSSGADAGWVAPDCTNAPVAKWADIYKAVISPGCGNYCHNGGTSNQFGGGLDLFPTDQARAWRNLVQQAPKPGYPCYQKGMRVVPGDPAKSIVYSKLIDMPICGKAEPQGTPAGKLGPWMPLPNDQICMFYTWIKAGALDN